LIFHLLKYLFLFLSFQIMSK